MNNITFFVKNPFGKYFLENINILKDFCKNSELNYNYIINVSTLSKEESFLYKKHTKKINAFYGGESFCDCLNEYIYDFCNDDPDLVIIIDCDKKITRNYLIQFILDVELSSHESSYVSDKVYAFKAKTNGYRVSTCENSILKYKGVVIENGKFKEKTVSSEQLPKKVLTY